MNDANQPLKTTLYFKQGRSDKVYQAAIEASGNGFVVNFAYGRRGSTLQTGTKTARPVDYAAARKIYDGLVTEKTVKGYSPGEDGTPYQHTDKEQRATGVFPQLLNPIDEAEVEAFLTDDRWWTQEKFDGKRLLIRKEDDAVIAINRTGLTAGLPQTIADAILKLRVKGCLVDGEVVGEVYYAFDALARDAEDLRKMPYEARHAQLTSLLKPVKDDHLRQAATAIGARDKRAMLEKVKAAKKEGVVFKDSAAPYTHGRPSSGGTQRKLKFYASASCIVAAVNKGKRSVSLDLFDGARRVGVGSVTVSANQPIPVADGIVEVRYLYAYSGGSLYQPLLVGVRDDLAANA